MNNVPLNPKSLFGEFMILWGSSALALGFLFWTIGSSPEEMRPIENGIRFYGKCLAGGVVIGGIGMGLFRLALTKMEILGLVSYVLGWVYLGFLKVLGWGGIPLILVGIIVVSVRIILIKKKSQEVFSSLILFHTMGTFSGLYMSFHLQDFLKGWEPFQEVLQGLWLFLSKGIFTVF